MFNPLLPDLTQIKDQDLETTISDLTRKYFIAARSGYGSVCDQISVTLEQYRDEQKRRLIEKSRATLKSQNKGLDDLINIS
jgi:hypothetical protein